MKIIVKPCSNWIFTKNVPEAKAPWPFFQSEATSKAFVFFNQKPLPSLSGSL